MGGPIVFPLLSTLRRHTPMPGTGCGPPPPPPHPLPPRPPPPVRARRKPPHPPHRRWTRLASMTLHEPLPRHAAFKLQDLRVPPPARIQVAVLPGREREAPPRGIRALPRLEDLGGPAH